MHILGVDPGTVRLGYGVVDVDSGMQLVDCGVVAVPPRAPIEQRLHLLYTQLSALIERHTPGQVAIEEPFVGRNARSALWVGRAQAVAILTAANRGLPVYYYSPAQVKQLVSSYGRSDKYQVQQMVKLHLGLGYVPEPSDAADALAVAICHVQHTCVDEWLRRRTVA